MATDQLQSAAGISPARRGVRQAEVASCCMWAAGRRTANPFTNAFGDRNGARSASTSIPMSNQTSSLRLPISARSSNAPWMPSGPRTTWSILSAHEVPVALGEFFRVLSPGGIVLITLPDLQQVAEFIVADKLEEVAYESAVGPITPLDCVFGLGKDIAAGRTLMAHRTGFTATTLRKHLERAGFGNVRIWFSPFALWAEGIKGRRD